MEYGVNVLSVLPVRKEPDHRSEMVNQLLFGEQFFVNEESGDWINIRGALDNYSGWISSGTSIPLGDPPVVGDPDPGEIISQPVRVYPADTPESSFLILPGSTLPMLDREKGEFILGKMRYKVHGAITVDSVSCSPGKLVQTALLFLNAPYLLGGRSYFGIDCSGLAQLVYKICGISLPRDASQQVLLGDSISFATDAEPGDLAFFAEEEEEISHVGIILNKNHIIHASGKVRIDNFDHQGIYQKEKQKYSHVLRVIRKYLPAS